MTIMGTGRTSLHFRDLASKYPWNAARSRINFHHLWRGDSILDYLWM